MAGTRLWIMIAIALPLVLLAPFTYNLTKVYRSPLPIEDIQTLNAASVSFDIPIHFWYRTSERMKQIQHWMKAMPEFENHPDAQLNYILHHKLMDIASSSDDAHDMDEMLHALKVNTSEDASDVEAEYTFFFDCDDSTKMTENTKWIMGKYRHAWTRHCDDRSTLVHLQRLFLDHLFPSPDHIRAETTFAPKYRLTFSLLNENPHEHVAYWTFPHIAERYLNGFLGKLSILADFTVDSQILHYANLSRTVYYDEDERVRCITTKDLQQFTSTNDYITTTILDDQERNLNFLAYVPSPERFPLTIVIQSSSDVASSCQDSQAHVAFDIPGWGGVAIHQRPTTDDRHLRSREFQHTMGYFIAHCRNAFGLRNGASGQVHADYAEFLLSNADGICDWELDIVSRSWLSRFVLTTVTTLKSIATLVTTMPQMTVVDRIRLNVLSAMALLQELKNVHTVSVSSYPKALTLARGAMRKADAAYYDPTMVTQLYFPEEHIYAVYLPLLFPLTLPLFAGMLREWKRYQEKKRSKDARESATAGLEKEKEE